MNTLLLLFLSVILVGLIIASYVIVTFGITAVFGAPYVGTSARWSRELLSLAGLQPGETVLDIGSGNGAILFVAMNEFKARKGIGIEINPLLVFAARWQARRQGLSKKLDFRRANAFKTTLPKTDVLALYLLPKMMDKLRPKIVKELDPGTRIVSRGFQFSNVRY